MAWMDGWKTIKSKFLLPYDLELAYIVRDILRKKICRKINVTGYFSIIVDYTQDPKTEMIVNISLVSRLHLLFLQKFDWCF